jgi:type IV pilus assembly protein PilV
MNASARGFTLLEVLVALVVLSVGLLGLAGLQLTSVTNTRDAYYRSQALVLSYDMSDRMRANLTGVDNGDYDAITGTAVSNCRTTTGCTPAQLATDDVFLWRAAVASSLPGGDAIVCIDSTPADGTAATSASCDGTGDQYVAKVWWDNDRNPATSAFRLTTVFIP